MKLGIIGYGNIGRELVRLMENDDLCAAVETTVLVRPGRSEGKAQVESIDELLKSDPDFVVEAAGHNAVKAFVGPCLSAGTDVVVASVGALADETLRAGLEASARMGGARLIIPSGAIGGIDMLAALGPFGVSSVSYSGRKPPAAWRGSLAQDLIDLDGLAEETAFFDGTAREAASKFPKNANVAATIALAGIGFDQTRVRLAADPAADGNFHEYKVTAAGAIFRFSVQGMPSTNNARTSAATVQSLLREVRNRIGPLAV